MYQWCRWRSLSLSMTISLLQMIQFLSLMEVHQLIMMSHPPPSSLMSLQQPRRRRTLPTTPLSQPPRKEDPEGPANPSQLLPNPARGPEADRTK